MGVTAAVFTFAVLAHCVLTHFIHNRRYVRNAFMLFGVVCLAALPLAIQFGLYGVAVMYLALVILWNLYLSFFINLIKLYHFRIIT